MLHDLAPLFGPTGRHLCDALHEAVRNRSAFVLREAGVAVVLVAGVRVREDPGAGVEARKHPDGHTVRQPVALSTLRRQ